MNNLFGNPMEEIKDPKKPISTYQKIKYDNNFQKKSPHKNKMCYLCSSYKSYEYHNKIYRKCKLIGISKSNATDINKNSFCNKFKNNCGD